MFLWDWIAKGIKMERKFWKYFYKFYVKLSIFIGKFVKMQTVLSYHCSWPNYLLKMCMNFSTFMSYIATVKMILIELLSTFKIVLLSCLPSQIEGE